MSSARGGAGPLLIAGLLVVVLLAGLLGLWWRSQQPWPEWQAFAETFIQRDGRVIDRTAKGRSTSEGQAYALFFAVVANDRERFEQLLSWTRDNLCEGDCRRRLPAWLWGEREDGTWGVIDPNPASDADLWMAYALMEAARLWDEPRLGETGMAMLWQVRQQSVVTVSAGDTLLLPAPQGFRLEDGRWRLNPSYLCEFQLRYFAGQDAAGPWAAIWRDYERRLASIAPAGLMPDWYLMDAAGGVSADTVLAPRGSYDAIRSYLWAGISAEAGIGAFALQRLKPFAVMAADADGPPESVEPYQGSVSGGRPLGFSAAVLPYLQALGEDSQTQHQAGRVRENRVDGNLGRPPHYYDQVLALFGEGWLAGRYRIDATGQLQPRWENLCCVF